MVGNAFKIVTEKAEAKRPFGVNKHEQVQNIKIFLMKDVRHVDWIQFVSLDIPMQVGKYVVIMWFCYLPNKDCSMVFVTLL